MAAYKDLAGVLNQLALTSGFDEARAANAWAGTSGLETLGALNKKAVNAFGNWKDFDGVCNQLAGTNGLAGVGALNKLAGNT